MEMTEAAVRVTNHNDEAVAWARCAAQLLDHLLRGLATLMDVPVICPKPCR
ncbi:hypothetical protein SAMN05216369_3242 [Marinobacter antarcticus]|uniref:Uncharacterized protein n=1 Tax=Marinobacter antarcticus TaxID=564117 RepID=A0A1M6VK83_9GAMM|nr:hypothetical protein [Marinobacter antarcticus]SHK81765.1 hypothetical protein SAMN05216369_3242 [Marinobacter antarcticus]